MGSESGCHSRYMYTCTAGECVVRQSGCTEQGQHVKEKHETCTMQMQWQARKQVSIQGQHVCNTCKDPPVRSPVTYSCFQYNHLNSTFTCYHYPP